MKTKGGIIETAMKYRQIVILIVSLMFFLGIYALIKMPKQEFPVFTVRPVIREPLPMRWKSR